LIDNGGKASNLWVEIETMDSMTRITALRKSWVVRKGFLGFFKSEYTVLVAEKPLNLSVPHMPAATAEISIRHNGKLVHEVETPWPLPLGAISLPMHAYTLAVSPGYAELPWRNILLQFCEMCEGFTPPKIEWTNEPLLD
jgi:hypothetical protein